MKLTELESELKQCWPILEPWHRKQHDSADRQTDYIYKVKRFVDVEQTTAGRFERGTPMYHYALNRWYNWWSSRAIEVLACQHPNVEQAPEFDKQVDFYINGIPFDHKNTVYPKGFRRGITHALAHQDEFVTWLYENQSTERRYHLANRLFVVFYAADGNHWKLKAELTWIRIFVDDYIEHFTPATLHTVCVNGTQAQADVIWCIQ